MDHRRFLIRGVDDRKSKKAKAAAAKREKAKRSKKKRQEEDDEDDEDGSDEERDEAEEKEEEERRALLLSKAPPSHADVDVSTPHRGTHSWHDALNPGAGLMNRRRLCQLTAAILTSDLTTPMWVL